MRLSGKMTVRFIAYFLLFYGILFIGTAIMVGLFLYRMMTGLYFHDIRALEQAEISTAVIESDHSFTFSESLVDIARRSGGFVQLLDAEGKILVSSEDEKSHKYNEDSEFISLLEDRDMRTWELGDKIVVFQEYTESDKLLASLQMGQGFPQLTDDDVKLLEGQGAIFELFDVDGKLLFSTSETASKWTLPAKLLLSSRSVNEQEELISYLRLANGDIAVLSMENPHYQALDSIDGKLFISFAKWFGLFHLLLLIITLGFSLWIGRIFGKPIFHFLEKIERLSNAYFDPLDDRRIRRQKDGRLKRKYRMYEDVDTSLGRLTEKLKENKRVIAQTEQLREDWITGLSHDLKTPLSSIYGYSAMLASDHQWSPEEIKTFAKTLLEKSGYMDELIKDLTFTYQLKSDGVVLNKEPINLHDEISDYIKRSDWHELISLTSDTDLYVEIDSIRFARVLDNIVGNAVKHNPEGTMVKIQLSGKTDKVILKVCDNGGGMSEEALEHLFNRYYRGTNTMTDSSGTGLGLTIAKQLVEAHGGQVEVTSSVQGTSIIIRLDRIYW